jgi:hypothetical protein
MLQFSEAALLNIITVAVAKHDTFGVFLSLQGFNVTCGHL